MSGIEKEIPFMKKTTFKMTALLLTLVMVLSLGFAGTALATDAPAEEVKPLYQLVGKYEEEGQGADRVNAAFKLELFEDGTAVCDRYRYMAKDATEAASNPSYDDAFMTGTWEAAQKDGIDCLKIELACDNNGTKANEVKMYAYEVVGQYSTEMDFPIVVGMDYKRTVSLASAEELLEDDDAFIAAYQLEDAVKSEGAADASADASQPAALAEELDTSAPCPFAGEYDVLNVNGDGEEFYFEEFIIEEDWSVHGAVEASGLTGFEGTVDGFGVISAEFKRLGGTMSGTVDLEGNVAGISEVRGRTSTFNGVIY